MKVLQKQWQNSGVKQKISKEEQKRLQEQHWYYHIDEYGEKVRDPAR